MFVTAFHLNRFGLQRLRIVVVVEGCIIDPAFIFFLQEDAELGRVRVSVQHSVVSSLFTVSVLQATSIPISTKESVRISGITAVVKAGDMQIAECKVM